MNNSCRSVPDAAGEAAQEEVPKDRTRAYAGGCRGERGEGRPDAHYGERLHLRSGGACVSCPAGLGA